MNKTLLILIILSILIVTACSPQGSASPTPVLTARPPLPVATNSPIAVTPTTVAQPSCPKILLKQRFWTGLPVPVQLVRSR